MILDEDIYNLWKSNVSFEHLIRRITHKPEQGWRGSVKSKHFIIALRDYFFTQTQERKHQGAGIHSQKYWAMHYLDLHYLRPILEAIDDDSSGFVSVEEINDFTNARPRDWG